MPSSHRTLLLGPAKLELEKGCQNTAVYGGFDKFALKKLQDINPRLEKIKEQYKGDQQKIAAETYLANQAGFPELIIGQNVTIGDSAIQDALKFARGLTAEQQAMWQAYTQKVVL